jgi:disulfide bond formation protein DsbB
MPALPSRATTLWLICGLCAAAVAMALVSQHRFDMQPCPWCILQRLIFIVIAVVAGAAALVASRGGAAGRGTALGGGLLIDLLATAGAAAALYQHFVAAQSNSCALTLADRIVSGLGLDAWWPDVFEVRATCAEAAVSVFGIPFEFLSLGLYLLVGALAVSTLLGALRSR